MHALLSFATEFATTIAALGWDPEIRGILIVVASVVILLGSIYLVVATNLGARLGMLVALSGLFGWFVIMGLVWWTYGIGRVGRFPSWEVVEVNLGDTTEAEVEDVRRLPAFDDLPTGEEVLAENPDLAEQFAGDPEVTLAEIAAVDPEALESIDLGGWEVLSTAEVGEAQAEADAFLVEAGYFGEAGEYVLLEGFVEGGKPQRESDSVVDRVTNKISTALTPTHPTRYAVIQVRAVVPQEVAPGEAAPRPEADLTQPVVSVVMERDIGERRVPTALFTIGSGILFIVTTNMLSKRDRDAKAAREAAEAGAGS